MVKIVGIAASIILLTFNSIIASEYGDCGGGYTDVYGVTWDFTCPERPYPKSTGQYACKIEDCCYRSRICEDCFGLGLPPKKEYICDDFKSIIYCPETLEPLYETTYDLSTRTGNDPVLAEDFKPVSEYIPQPVNGTRMVCPGTNIPLNGFEYFYWKRGYSLPKLAYQAVSLLTKDKKGNFVWLPYSYEELINILALD